MTSVSRRVDPEVVSVDQPAFDPPAVSPWADGAAKRAFDVVVAGPVAVLTLPLLVLLCSVSAVVFRANPLFTQDRIGRDGQRFRFLKVRSLAPTVPADIDKYALAAQPLGRWGAFVRRTHLDELPQLWLVLAGQMSLVGPRPELPAIAATFDQAFVERRTTVRPGITGVWQVGDGAAELIGESPDFDDLYLRSASLRLDLWVMWRTVAGAFGASPVSIDDCRRVVGTGAGPAASGTPVPTTER